MRVDISKLAFKIYNWLDLFWNSERILKSTKLIFCSSRKCIRKTIEDQKKILISTELRLKHRLNKIEIL
jgi:hypothetical protein